MALTFAVGAHLNQQAIVVIIVVGVSIGIGIGISACLFWIGFAIWNDVEGRPRRISSAGKAGARFALWLLIISVVFASCCCCCCCSQWNVPECLDW